MSLYSFFKTIHKNNHLLLRFLPSYLSLVVSLGVKLSDERILLFSDSVRSLGVEII